jgi:hypothetical protein
MKGFLKRHWAQTIFWITATASFVSLCIRPTGMHYRLFSSPSHYFWTGQDPYGLDFGTGFGTYPYSPSCSMFFFSLFAWLPGRVGQGVYIAFSVAFFTLGLRYFVRVLERQLGWAWSDSPVKSLIWLCIGSEMTGGILAAKIEIFEVGVLFFCCGMLLENRLAVLTAILMAWIANWKFQVLPVAGLVAVVGLVYRRDWRWSVTFAVALVGFCLLPALFMPWDAFVHITFHWVTDLSSIIARNWEAGFQHIYTFLSAQGLRVSLQTATRLNGLVALLLALFFALCARRFRRQVDPAVAEKTLTLAAFGTGLGYVLLFSLLSQSNAYILYAPLLFATVVASELNGVPSRLLGSILIAAYFLISIAFSDLTPRPLRAICRDHAVKPIGVALVLSCLLILLALMAWGKARARARAPLLPQLA